MINVYIMSSYPDNQTDPSISCNGYGFIIVIFMRMSIWYTTYTTTNKDKEASYTLHNSKLFIINLYRIELDATIIFWQLYIPCTLSSIWNFTYFVSFLTNLTFDTFEFTGKNTLLQWFLSNTFLNFVIHNFLQGIGSVAYWPC